jgi:hypothetical protein
VAVNAKLGGKISLEMSVGMGIGMTIHGSTALSETRKGYWWRVLRPLFWRLLLTLAWCGHTST